jgi:hypothetical protein
MWVRSSDLFEALHRFRRADGDEPPGHLTERGLRETLYDLAPAVALLTGRLFDPSSVEVRLLTREGLEARLRADAQRRTGLPLGTLKIIENGTSEAYRARGKELARLLNGRLIACYSEVDACYYVLAENLRGANQAAVREALLHESVHAVQHQTFPEIFAELANLQRLCFVELARHGEHSPHLAELEDALNAVLTLIESHAAYVQELAHEAMFPEAKLPEIALDDALLGNEDLLKKYAQYERGQTVMEDWGSDPEKLAKVFRRLDIVKLLFMENPPGIEPSMSMTERMQLAGAMLARDG